MKSSTQIVIGLAVAAALALTAVGIAAGQSDDDCTPTAWPGGHRGWGMWECGARTAFDAAAEALGLSPQQLFTELHGGKTLQQVVEAEGVGLETVQEALNTAREEARKAAIQQAVEDGTLTQQQADWLLEGLELGFGPFGGGPGGFRGHLGAPR
jgi:hypothetical protein